MVFGKCFSLVKKARSYDIFFSWTVDLLFINSSIDIYCLVFISHHIKQILSVNTNSKENQSWKKNKGIYTFTCLWCRVNIPHQQFFSVSWTFQKQQFPGFLQNRGSKKFRNILNWEESPTQMFSCKYCEIFKICFFTELLRWLLGASSFLKK